MRILIITMNVGRTASGIVFERLIQGLSSLHQIDILTADYDPSIDLSNIRNAIISKKPDIHSRIHMFLISLLSVDLFDYVWTWKSMRLLKSKKLNQYDLVFSFLSSFHYTPLIAGKEIAIKYKYKYAVYSVDAIPVPMEWLDDYRYYRGVKSMLEKYLGKADAFFSANEKMLAYQLSTVNLSKSLFTEVLYSPSIGSVKNFSNSNFETNYFVYTGGIYRARKVEYLLEGFEKLLELYPDSYVIFVGSDLSPSSLCHLNQRTLERIKILPFTKELDQYYSCSTALIDIDADLENDVFLSSKIVNYIMINRIIITETGENSPSRHLFKEINSIIQCNHDSDQIYKAMINSIKMKGNITFEDRKSVSELFSLENVVKRLNISLNKLTLK